MAVNVTFNSRWDAFSLDARQTRRIAADAAN